jgi:hypothetical protein
MQTPIFNTSDTVYLRESAALGFIEAYIVDSIIHHPNGTLTYQCITHLKPPTATMTMGDRHRGTTRRYLEFLEQDLATYCEALELAEANLSTQLATIQARRLSAGCDTGTE